MHFFSSIRACRINLSSGPGFIHMLHLPRDFSCSLPISLSEQYALSQAVQLPPAMPEPSHVSPGPEEQSTVYFEHYPTCCAVQKQMEGSLISSPLPCMRVMAPTHGRYLLTGTGFRKHLLTRECLSIHKLKQSAESGHF